MRAKTLLIDDLSMDMECKRKPISPRQAPGASVADVALALGVNANRVRRWMREQGIALPTHCAMPILNGAPAFVSLPVPSVQRDAPAI